MATITLQVYDSENSELYTYSGVNLEDVDPSYSQQSGSSDIEAGTVNLRLIGESFMGQFSAEDLLDGPYRCLVQYTSDAGLTVDIVNGRIHRGNVTQFKSIKLWSIRCIDDAVDYFFERLEETPVPNTGAFIDMDTAKSESDGGVTVDSSRWWNIEEMWNELILDILNVFVSYQEVRQFFHLDIEYDDSGTDRVISRKLPLYVCYQEGILQLPDWNGGQLFDVLRKLLGWRAQAQFQPFPSNIVTATILTDQFLPPLTERPDIDELERFDDPFGISFLESQEPDFAIQYKNNVGDEPLHSSLQAPSSLAIYAANQNKLDAEGKGVNRSLLSLPVYIPDSDTTVGNNGTESNYQPDATSHPNYLEGVVWAVPGIQDRDRVYICGIQDITGEGNRMVTSRQPNNPSTNQLGSTAEYWATELYRNYVLSISTLFRVRGTILFSDLSTQDLRPVVGNPGIGVRLYGENWMLESINWNLDQEEAELSLLRLEETPEVVIDLPIVCPPGPVSVVQTLFGPDPDFQLSWTSPDPACAQQLPASYDVYIQEPGDSDLIFVTNVTDTSYITGPLTGGGYGLYVFGVKSKTAGGVASEFRTNSIVNVDIGDAP